jgi:hypothetical protein
VNEPFSHEGEAHGKPGGQSGPGKGGDRAPQLFLAILAYRLVNNGRADRGPSLRFLLFLVCQLRGSNIGRNRRSAFVNEHIDL